MKIDELTKKPIAVIVENNISDDMVFPDTTIAELITMVRAKLHDEVFLLVYVDSKENKQIISVITSSDLEKLIGLIVDSGEVKITSELNFGAEFPLKFSVEISEPIQIVLDMFEKENTDVIVVKSNEGKYQGKIKRNKLKEWFNIMANN